VVVEAAMSDAAGLRLAVWRPFAKERPVRKQPVRLTLKPYEAAVVLAI
jgi:hypothetical protein